MKYLEIANGKGFFRRGTDMVELDRICKNDLLDLIACAEQEAFEMDEYDESLLHNRAHQVIYLSLVGKLSEFRQDRNRFNSEVEKMYAEAVGKYQVDLDTETYVDEELVNEEEDEESGI